MRRTIGMLLAVFCLGTLLACSGQMTTQQEVPITKTQPAPALMSREEFSKLVLGKTKDEVQKAIGKPDQASSLSPYTEREYWYYEKKTDAMAQLVIKDGKVIEVSY